MKACGECKGRGYSDEDVGGCGMNTEAVPCHTCWGAPIPEVSPADFESGDWASALSEALWRYDWATRATVFQTRPSEGYAGSVVPFDVADIERVIAADEGYGDEWYVAECAAEDRKEDASWIAALLLKDGRYVMVRARCDYTGWGCRAHGDSDFADSLDNLVRWAMTTEERIRLGFAVRGAR